MAELVSLAGIWKSSSGKKGGVVPHIGQGELGENNIPAIVVSGWFFHGSFGGEHAVTPVNYAVFMRGDDGLMKLQEGFTTSGNHQTNGTGSIQVADFNGDRVNDVFLGAHNESPFINQSSTLLLSGDDGYSKVTVSDSVQNHSTNVFELAGNPSIVGANFGGGTAIYTWEQKSENFKVSYSETEEGTFTAPGSSAVIGDFDGDGHLEVAISDNSFGPGLPWIDDGYGGQTQMGLHLYRFDTSTSTVGSLIKRLPNPYFDGKPEYAHLSSFSEVYKSHQHRVNAKDINGDGLLDLLVSTEVWNQALPANEQLQAGKIQILVNKGGLVFSDETDVRQPGIPLDLGDDHSPIFDDFDNSGAISIFQGSRQYPEHIKSSSLLLNDGTGNFHLMDGSQFDIWKTDVHKHVVALMQSKSITDGVEYYADENSIFFRPYKTADGKMNYVAFEVATYQPQGGLEQDILQLEVAININAQHDPNVDFTDDVTVRLDSMSTSAHGWAGNDTFVASAGNHAIDGGAGTDTAIYKGGATHFSLTIAKGAATSVQDRNGTQGTDSLTSIEKIDFQTGSKNINLDALDGVVNVSSSDLSAFIEMYIAYFDRAPDAEGLFYWGTRLSEGMSKQDIAKSFYVQPETQALYTDPDDTEGFVTAVYQNFLGRAPDAEGFAYWVNQLDTGSVSKPIFLLAIINGAKAATGDPTDVAYFTAKANIGAYYSVIKGMSNTENAKAAMALYDGTAASIVAAKNAIDNYYAAAIDANTGELLINLVGVMDDPFAA